MRDLRRIGPGDALIGLALLTLVFAALLPAYRARAFDDLVDDALADVEALRTAMLTAREASAQWPPAMPVGRIPTGAAAAFGGDTTMARPGYALEWSLWRRVDRVRAPPRPPAPPSLDEDESPPPVTTSATDPVPDSVGPETVPVVREEGAIVVHSTREELLGALLERYGPEVSWVHDTLWTLVVTPGAGRQAP